MIQMDLDKIAKLFADNGYDFADYPDLAAKIMVLNEDLAAAPGFSIDVLREMTEQLMKNDDD